MSGHIREIVKIDEEKCDGCGLCIPNCAEGAIQVIDGKAKLVADNLCDGLGDCLGTCPQGAITIEKRSAVEFDEAAVKERLSSFDPGGSVCASGAAESSGTSAPDMPCGCPGTMARQLAAKHDSTETGCCDNSGNITDQSSSESISSSQLGHWPVQLRLLPPQGAMWQNADIMIAADCVSVAMGDFHDRLLKGRSVAIGCPKLDDLASYESKLTEVFKINSIKSVTVAHMEVPCCNGIVIAVRNAISNSGKTGLKFTDVMVSIEGKIMHENTSY